ncbi:MAG: hypothetical protein ACLQU1_15320 [Bryobacteraceae bacterium]
MPAPFGLSARLGLSAAIGIAIAVAGCVAGNSGNRVAGILMLLPGIVAQPFAKIIHHVSQSTRQVIVGVISAGAYTPVLYFLLGVIWADRSKQSSH